MAFLDEYQANTPLRQVCNVERVNRITNVLMNMSGVGCDVHRDFSRNGRGWKIVVHPQPQQWIMDDGDSYGDILRYQQDSNGDTTWQPAPVDTLVGNGLKVDSKALSVGAGKGLYTDTTSVNAGSGNATSIGDSSINVNVSSSYTIVGDEIGISTNKLEYVKREYRVAVNTNNALYIAQDTWSWTQSDTAFYADSGLSFDGKNLVVNTGPGLSINSDSVQVNAGSGLSIDGDSVQVNTDTTTKAEHQIKLQYSYSAHAIQSKVADRYIYIDGNGNVVPGNTGYTTYADQFNTGHLSDMLKAFNGFDSTQDQAFVNNSGTVKWVTLDSFSCP